LVMLRIRIALRRSPIWPIFERLDDL